MSWIWCFEITGRQRSILWGFSILMRSGIIEVMGLAVLPARLRTELSNLGEAILENREISSDPVLGKHYNFSQEIRKKYQNITKDTVEEIVRAEVGKVFLMVLRDAGIFKEDEAGKEGFRRFIASLS